MYANKDKTGTKTDRELIFGDAEAYTIPASEGWNEGYSHSNKFLYITNKGMSGKAGKATTGRISPK